MNKTETEKKIERLASQNPVSGWKSKVEFRRKNKDWLQKSAAIAVHIFERLKELGKTQKELAAEMSVSPQRVNKILKGAENLTIETISKIEQILEIKLHEVLEAKAQFAIDSKAFEYITVENRVFHSSEIYNFVHLPFASKTILKFTLPEKLDFYNLKSSNHSPSELPKAEKTYHDVFDKDSLKEGEIYSEAA
jgi:transcriptional regulator with XRE-family HTH domain